MDPKRKGRARSMRRVFAVWLLVGAATRLPIGLVAARAAAAEPPVGDRPNIVVIMSDDMGYSDIGCYGGEIQTPVLDRLAEHGVRFTQFYNTGRCCPTRASLLTGLYPHQTGMGHMTGDDHLPGYRGEIGRQCVTIAEALGSAGYRTYMCGKWHVCRDTGADGPQENWPLQRGFEKFYGTLTGAGSFYDPTTLCRGNTLITPENDPEYRPDVYYYTDAISDNAIQFVRQHAGESPDRPFFLYVAFTAAHWPMHALPEDIAKYEGRYDQGYGPMRAERLAKMKRLGLVPEDCNLSPPAGDWSQVEHAAWEARCMEVYAAMIDRMDQGIGRLVKQLQEQGELENTLLLFLQDNGGCAEGMGRKDNPRHHLTGLKPFGKDDLQPQIWPPMQTRDGRPVLGGPDVMPGPADTYIGYGKNWANVSNTPFREYKHWVHEGGISTPLIVHWPRRIPGERRGVLERQPGHLIDIMATCLDAAGASYPEQYRNETITALEGTSLLPAVLGQKLARKDLLYWEHEGNRAVRDGKWKLVAKGHDGPWELYDLERDRTEQVNLASLHPERVQRLAQAWESWAGRAAVKPWPWDQAKAASTQTSFVLTPGAELAKEQAPQVGGRAFQIQARIQQAGPGVIVAQGGTAHGYSLYLDDQRHPVVALRRAGKLETIRADQACPEGKFVLEFTLGTDGQVTLSRDGQQLLERSTAGLLKQTPVDGCSVGRDANDPVGNYPREHAFAGTIDQVRIKLQ